jgi:hypothetical protein
VRHHNSGKLDAEAAVRMHPELVQLLFIHRGDKRVKFRTLAVGNDEQRGSGSAQRFRLRRVAVAAEKAQKLRPSNDKTIKMPLGNRLHLLSPEDDFGDVRPEGDGPTEATGY